MPNITNNRLYEKDWNLMMPIRLKARNLNNYMQVTTCKLMQKTLPRHPPYNIGNTENCSYPNGK